MASPPSQHHHHPISIKSAARKLPIKRKSPDLPSNPNPKPNPIPKLEPPDLYDDLDDDLDDLNKPPPFKFHRIWTESDELRFLQGLLDSASHGFIFPRDLHLFYHRFSQSTPQPYTKSQLSEKLRRLRKKFRVISSRISRGLDPSLISPHDRALLGLSKRLWHPDFSDSSPFNSNCKQRGSGSSSRVRVKEVTFAPPDFVDPSSRVTMTSDDRVGNGAVVGGDEDDGGFEDLGNLDDGHGQSLNFAGGVERIAAKTVVDVFDKCLNEVRTVLVGRGLIYPDQRSGGGSMVASSSSLCKEEKEAELMKRCREQRVAELGALGRRLRLVLENSIHHH